MPILQIVASLALLFADRNTSQPTTDEQTHGTINVVLANGKGAVVVTDSRLSSAGKPVGFGQKLFMLDEHTVCAIAGFYSDLGPQAGLAPYPEYPLSVSVPQILGRGSFSAPIQESNSVSKRLLEISETYAFVLTVLANMSVSREAQPSTITVVGYEGSKLHISGVTLKPYRIGSSLTFVPTASVNRVVDKALVSRITGISDVGLAMLSHPTWFNNSPIMRVISKSLVQDDGTSLSTEQLRRFGEQIESETAMKYDNYVGGERQEAIFESGKLSFINSYVNAKPTQSGLLNGIELIDHSSFEGLGSGLEHSGDDYTAGDYIASVVKDSQLSKLTVDLDGRAFVSDRIDNCILVYRGYKPTALGKSNTISNSVLKVSRNVMKDDRFVQQIQSDFPSLKVEIQK